MQVKGIRSRLAAHPFIVVVGLCILAIALFFVHPYLFGLPGRIAETLFQSGLHQGLPRADVIRLASKLGGMDTMQDRINSNDPRWTLDLSHGAPGQLDIIFIDSLTFCIEGGNWYTLNFGADWKLRSWSEQPWGSGC